MIICVVLNHTSQDSLLVTEHPESFHRDAEGNPYTTVPQWTDIIDLAHPRADLTRYLIDSLVLWVRRGVDGFRCDVASLVSVDFWVQAREEPDEIKPGLLWLAETVHPSMVENHDQYRIMYFAPSPPRHWRGRRARVLRRLQRGERRGLRPGPTARRRVPRPSSRVPPPGCSCRSSRKDSRTPLTTW